MGSLQAVTARTFLSPISIQLLHPGMFCLSLDQVISQEINKIWWKAELQQSGSLLIP